MNQICPCCHSSTVKLFKTVVEYDYYNCLKCDSIFIDPAYLLKIDNGFNIVKYEEGYWDMELKSAKERAYGPALARMAEAVYYCKRPIKKFLDIGTGPGYFLDAVEKLLPDNAQIFYGVELFPPDIEFRSKSKNYIVDDIGNLTDKFDCGICIEVIEHLTPVILDDILKKLAKISNPEALYIFNTGMPEYVKNEDINYLDPHKRGHLVSYSLKAMSLIAGKHGFTVHEIKGKTWAFALEFTNYLSVPAEDIRDRIWKASEQNVKILTDSNMGSALKILGLETARAYH
jgi:SAM-dependent methyltransferase